MTVSLHICDGLFVPVADIEILASRSSGPGGQHANVTASRIEAVFDVHGSSVLNDAQKARISARIGPRVTAVAQDTRSQTRNRELALERLAQKLRDALYVPPRRTKNRPTAASRRRRLDDKRRRGQKKEGRRRPDTD
jgi:ribosome-associated protein